MQVAWPAELTGAAPHPGIVKPLAVKVTVPPLTVVLLLTVAVKGTELLGAVANDGLLFEDMEVVVGTALGVVMFRLQPPATAPVPSPANVVRIYKLHVPLGLVP